MSWRFTKALVAVGFGAALSACAAEGAPSDAPSKTVVAEKKQALYAGCTELGPALVDHACFHAQLGPFGTVSASATRTFAAATPNINTVHTHFTVHLPGSPGANEGTVKYRPARSGEWTIMTNPANLPMVVLNSADQPVPLVLDHAVSRCPQLPQSRIYELTANETYRVVIGPASVSSVGVVIEKLSDFESFYYADGDRDGFGDGNDAFVTACTAPAGRVTDDTDCNDASAATFPGAPEQCDTIDNDCDGEVDEGAGAASFYRDADGDGFGNAAVTVQGCTPPSGYVANDDDCNDAASAVNPAATETCNSVDDNCSGAADEGVLNACGACGAVPAETCDGVDNDCDGQVDEGVLNACGACGEAPSEVCDGADNDCDGQVDDGVLNACGACGAVPAEVCDGTDNDCDGQTDEGLTNACGTCGAVPSEVCGDGADNDCDGQVDEGCNTCVPVSEVCDGSDNDCDGQVDEGVLNDCGACGAVPSEVCGDGTDNDCDGTVDEGCNTCVPATEVCDGADNDCDGEVDEGLATTFYRDADSDGYGDPSATTQACAEPAGYVTDNTDCNDQSAASNPEAEESCDGADNDCDGEVDNVEDPLHHVIEHSCGHAQFGPFANLTAAAVGGAGPAISASHTAFTVALPGQGSEHAGEVSFSADEANDFVFLMDNDAAIALFDAEGNAVAPERQQAVDDCPALSRVAVFELEAGDYRVVFGPTSQANVMVLVEEMGHEHEEGEEEEGEAHAEGASFHRDADADGFGDPESTTFACSAPAGYVANDADCDDSNVAVNPDAAEICDEVDNDCNGEVDDVAAGSCNGCVPSDEVCDGADNDCDGEVDEQGQLSFWSDADQDGYGAGTAVQACEAPEGYVDNDQDCDDAAVGVHPGAAEMCDELDNDCDGTVDGGDVCAQCAPITLSARKTYRPQRHQDAEVKLDHVAQVAIPAKIRLNAGCSLLQEATLSWRDPRRNRELSCTYRGLGVGYALVRCSAGVRAGAVISTNELSLRVNGLPLCGTTEATVTLPDLSCE